MHICIQAWLPYPIQIWVNGRGWLGLQLTALAFDLPLVWFFLPPPQDHRTLHRTTNIVSELYGIVLGEERQLGPVYDRLRQLGIDEPSEPALTVETLTGRPSPARQANYRERRSGSEPRLVTTLIHQCRPSGR